MRNNTPTSSFQHLCTSSILQEDLQNLVDQSAVIPAEVNYHQVADINFILIGLLNEVA